MSVAMESRHIQGRWIGCSDMWLAGLVPVVALWSCGGGGGGGGAAGVECDLVTRMTSKLCMPVLVRSLDYR